MAEQQPQPNGSCKPGAEDKQDFVTALPGQPQPETAAPADRAFDLVLEGAVEFSDDTPTVISRQLPQPAFAGGATSVWCAGRMLAHFELIEPIGAGGMAAVFRARDTQLERYVALKVLPSEMASDSESVRRFHQEARAAAKLDHENIARVFYCGEEGKIYFIAFEYVQGENLRTLLEHRGRMPVPEAVTTCSRSPPDWRTRPREASFIVTSSRPTSSSHRRGVPSWSIWVWPASQESHIRQGLDAVRRDPGHVRLHLARASAGSA